MYSDFYAAQDDVFPVKVDCVRGVAGSDFNSSSLCILVFQCLDEREEAPRHRASIRPGPGIVRRGDSVLSRDRSLGFAVLPI